MLETDRDALICDFVETYHILDMRSLPGTLVATLACGLRENSRIKMTMAGQRIDTQTALQALILDGINTLLWSKQKRASKANKPESVYKKLMGEEDQKKEVTVHKGIAFDSVEELDAAMNRVNKKER